jgi:hypothetical protein
MRDRHFILLVCLLVVLTELPFLEYITDDTFIHLQFAKNFSAGHGFSFNAGEPTYGFTSPAWVLLISGVGLTGAELLWTSKALGLLSLLVGAALFYALALRVSSDRYLARTAAVVWAVNAWSVRWGISGMETSLVATWAVCSLYLFLRELSAGRSRHHPWVLGLACLVRPEAVLLLVICGAAAALSSSERRWRQAARTVLPGAVVCLAWFSYAFVKFGTVSPNTVAVKAGRFISLARAGESTYVVGKILGLTNAPELILAASAIAAAVLSRTAARRPSAFHLAAVGWLVLLPAAYVLRDVQVVSRYLVPVIPFLVLYGFLALRSTAGAVGPLRARVRQLTFGLAAVCVCLNLGVLGLVAYPHTHSFSRDMRRSLVYLGKWFALNTPADATVALPDIGAFAYYSDRRVVDLGGLVTPEMIPVLRGHELDQVITDFLFARVSRPDYVIDRARAEFRLLGVSRLNGAITPVASASVSSLGITRPGSYYYTAYRIDWDRLERFPVTPVPAP